MCGVSYFDVFQELVKAARNKLQAKGNIKIFTKQGIEVEGGLVLEKGDLLIVCKPNEKFTGNFVKPTTTTTQQPTEKTQTNSDVVIAPPGGSLSLPVIQNSVKWWSNYRFLNIKFSVTRGEGNSFPGEKVSNMNELGKVVEESYLTIPEIRELLLNLESTVDNPENFRYVNPSSGRERRRLRR